MQMDLNQNAILLYYCLNSEPAKGNKTMSKQRTKHIFGLNLAFLCTRTDIQLERQSEELNLKQRVIKIYCKWRKDEHWTCRMLPVMWCDHVSLVSILGQTLVVSVQRDSPHSRWPCSNRWSHSEGGDERSDICYPQLTPHIHTHMHTVAQSSLQQHLFLSVLHICCSEILGPWGSVSYCLSVSSIRFHTSQLSVCSFPWLRLQTMTTHQHVLYDLGLL